MRGVHPSTQRLEDLGLQGQRDGGLQKPRASGPGFRVPASGFRV